MRPESNRRVLVVDDNRQIHEDFKKILGAGDGGSGALDDFESALFGDDAPAPAAGAAAEAYEIESALQGAEALAKAQEALAKGHPFALAFVDMRMPPGWDGVETIENLWKADPALQVVICTAFSDYTWTEMVARLGRTDRLLILKKPFDPIEVCQLASALTEKWNVTLRERVHLQEVVRAEQEARSYAASLETLNRALETAKKSAEATSQAKSEFLTRMARDIQGPLGSIRVSAEGVLELDAGDEGWAASAELICREAGLLISTLHQLEQYSEVEAGRLAVHATTCQPRRVAREVVASLDGEARARAVPLALTCSESVPEQIVTDPERLREILTCVIDDALRCATPGGVELQIDVENLGEWSGTVLRFDVRDRGPEVAEGRRNRLFEPLAPDPGSRERGGLPLSLSRRIARLLGGDLRYEPLHGVGNCIRLTLPAQSPRTARVSA